MLPTEARQDVLNSLSDEEAAALLFDWHMWARPEQLAPVGEWSTWLIRSGRGWGKTRTGAQWVIEQARLHPHGALVGATVSDVRDTMIMGESGILASSPPDFYPEYLPSKRLVRWPNGATALTYSAEKPDRLRGPNNHWAWCDELAAWKYPEAFQQLKFTLRGGIHPRMCITTTPRPTPLIREINAAPSTHVTVGSTYDNIANLAASFIEEVIRPIENTRLGRQEVGGEILNDTPGALWTMRLIEATRVTAVPNFIRIVVGVDPSSSDTDSSDETGIIVMGIDVRGHIYVIDDLSLRGSPAVRYGAVVKAYHEYVADCCVVETNNGGDNIISAIQAVDPSVTLRKVTASRGKMTRAEPISVLYENGTAHHIGAFKVLEDQMTTYVPGEKSPDHMDALVWAATALTTGPSAHISFGSEPTPQPVNTTNAFLKRLQHGTHI